MLTHSVDLNVEEPHHHPLEAGVQVNKPRAEAGEGKDHSNRSQSAQGRDQVTAERG